MYLCSAYSDVYTIYISMFIEALDIFYSLAISLQFVLFFRVIFFFLSVCRHFLCTGNHRKQFSAASKMKRSMNQYLCWKCVLVAFSIIFLLLLLVLLFIHFCCLLSFDSDSHQSEGRTVQTISEYKLSLNLLQGELFS